MLKLIRKDWLAARWFLLANLAAILLYSLQPPFADVLVMVPGFCLVLINLAAVFFFEDRNKTEILYLSFPVKRRDVVASRHLLGGLSLAGVGLAVFGVIGPLAGWIRPAGRSVSFPLHSVEAAAVFAVFSAVFASLYLIFYHRFGFGKGTMAFVVVAVLLLSAVVAAVVTRFPDDFDAAKNAEGVRTVFGCLHALRASLGTPLFLLAAAAAVIVPFLVSLSLSQRFYARREF